MRFRLAPRSMTLDDLELLSLAYKCFSLMHSLQRAVRITKYADIFIYCVDYPGRANLIAVSSAANIATLSVSLTLQCFQYADP